MGASKLAIHNDQQIQLAEFAKVLAHPARIAILDYISKQTDCICGDIVDEIGLSQPTISQHLQVIRNAGLLQGSFKGKSFGYCLDKSRFEAFQQVFQKFFSTTTARCC